ncbi:MAG: hypothetical protein OXG44_07370 [Gammaproteobacteria bacterium]|nr:hypothetical protein [Gammaproteobacteria bacterium]
MSMKDLRGNLRGVRPADGGTTNRRMFYAFIDGDGRGDPFHVELTIGRSDAQALAALFDDEETT